MLSGKSSDMKNGIIEYMEKNGALPDIVLINKPRCVEQQYVSFEGLEEIKDIVLLLWEVQGRYGVWTKPTPCVFANEPPDWTKFSLDRWRVFRIEDVRGGAPLRPPARSPW